MASSGNTIDHQHTFLGGRTQLARFVARPVMRFIHREVSGGIVLLIATAAALIWANSRYSASYATLWHTEISFEFWIIHFHEELLHVVNDGFMALFFFVVGLEIKRELVDGELRDPRAAALPAIAAVGGMVVPALLFFVFNSSGDGSAGWGIPMATDIAFAVGVLALLGSRVPARLKLFLLTLAIVDDIGAILVIALFYTDQLSFGWLATAIVGLVIVAVLRSINVHSVVPYVVVGIGVWFAMLESGVHATIAGVTLGLMTPARALLDKAQAQDIVDAMPDDPAVSELRHTAAMMRESVSVAHRLETALHPYTAYLVIPIFALANAGITISGSAVADAATSGVTIGVVFGLFIGKPVGVLLFTWIATRIGFPLPRGTRWGQMAAVGMAAGIGFTVSLFITGLAFDSTAIQDEAKMGILFASAIAAVAAMIMMTLATRKPVDGPGVEAPGMPAPAPAAETTSTDSDSELVAD